MENDKKELPTLAIVVPCYNEEEILQESLPKLLEVLENLIEKKEVCNKSYVSFVDDGSSDSTFKILKEESYNNKKIRILKLLYNAGHQKALLCGIKENDADIYLSIDCDLQDDIDVIPDMIKKYKEQNLDVVYGIHNDRQTDSYWKKNFAEAYYKLIALLLSSSNSKSLSNHADFRLITRNVALFLRQINEHNLYLRGLIYNQNFKHDIVCYSRKKRNKGVSKYNIPKMFNLAINGIIGQTLLPIRLISLLGGVLFLSSLFVKSQILLIGGINLIATGILGEYLGRAFIEVQNRPNYIVSDKINY